MNKILLSLVCAVASLGAMAQENKVTVNAGSLLPSTVNATVGYERTFAYGNAIEIFGEIGSQRRGDDNSQYKDVGILYKHRLHRYKNGSLRVRFGPQLGAVDRRFFFGLEGGFEYVYVFSNGIEFSLIQKNNVNFLNGDTFRNGFLIGLKIPF